MSNRPILFYMPNFHGGGAERVNVLLANELALLGLDVSILVVDNAGPNAEKVAKEVNVLSMGLPSGRWKWLVFPLSMFYLFWTVLRLKATVVSGVFYNNLQASLVGKLVVDSKVIVVEHTIKSKNDSARTTLFPVMRYLTKVYCDLSDAVVAVSGATKLDLIDSFGVSGDKISVIYNPVQLGVGGGAASGKKNRIVFVGRLIPLKRVDRLIEAFKQLVDDGFSNYILDIYGEGPMRDSLEALVKKLALSGSVFFKGYSNNQNDIFCDAVLNVLPSEYEGFGNVIIEAMSYGVPTVACSGSGGPEELIRAGVNGYLCEVDDLVKGIRYCVDFRFDDLDMIAGSHRFAPRVVAKQYARMVESL